MLKSHLHRNRLEAGCDEAGRGCLAGPVFAAAVILPEDFKDPVLNDSKKLSEKARYRLRKIIESEAIAFGIASVGPDEIDTLNILKASILAMHRAIASLETRPDYLLIDGNRFDPYPGISHTTVVKGDSIYLSIAAASVLAKTYRDDFMRALHREFPRYGWNSNKGYPTGSHRNAIREFGPTLHHRRSFTLLPRQYRLNFD
jgi:ribonuclease HII